MRNGRKLRNRSLMKIQQSKGKLVKHFGEEFILDLHNCDKSTFTRKSIRKYLIKLCDLIGMDRESLFWWDYYNSPIEYAKAPKHLKGTSAVQFIKTSNITIHTLDELRYVYVNIFSCKPFCAQIAANFTREYFKGTVVKSRILKRI